MNSRLLVILILLVFAVLVIQIYKGTVNEFSPKHIGTAYLLTTGEPITAEAGQFIGTSQGYYTFVAMIMEVTDIDMYRLPVSPIMLIPYLVVFFAFLYTLCRRSLLALVASLLLTFVLFTLALDGTHKIWLWSHGLGEILFFTFVMLLAIPITGKGVPNAVVGLLIVGATVSISYNNAYYIVVLAFSLVVVARVRRGGLQLPVQRFLLGLCLFAIACLFGPSRFVLDTFVPALKSVPLTLDPIRVFLANFFGFHGDDELLQLALRYPSSLTIINIVKQMIYGAIILTGLTIAIRNFRHSDDARDLSIMLHLSIVVAVISFVVVRFFFGHFAVGDVFKVVIFSIPVITYTPVWSRRLNIQKGLIAMLVILLILNLTTLSIGHRNNLAQDDSYHHITAASDWLYRNVEGYVYLPEELTYGWSIITYCERLPHSAKVVPTYLQRDDLLSLYYAGDISGRKTMIVNYRANYVRRPNTWENWLPFREFRETIEANPSIQARIYALNDDIVIVRTRE